MKTMGILHAWFKVDLGRSLARVAATGAFLVGAFPLARSMRFFLGVFHPSDAAKVPAALVSVHVLSKRKSFFPVGDWIMDSGAFSTIAKHGGYPEPVSAYAAQIKWFAGCGNLLAAVSQDYMCEPIACTNRLGVDAHVLIAQERGRDALSDPGDRTHHLGVFDVAFGDVVGIGIGGGFGCSVAIRCLRHILASMRGPGAAFGIKLARFAIRFQVSDQSDQLPIQFGWIGDKSDMLAPLFRIVTGFIQAKGHPEHLGHGRAALPGNPLEIVV
jgi:hypothetical protein